MASRSRSPRSDTLTRWTLADVLPDTVTGGSLWPEGSLAFAPVSCHDLPHRLHLISRQLLAQAALNKALMTLGLSMEPSLHSAIQAASREHLITARQTKFLYSLNSQANDAKHIPIVDEEDTSATSASSSSPNPPQPGTTGS